MPSGSLATSARASAPECQTDDRRAQIPALCRPVLDQIFRETVIFRLRLAHPRPAPANASDRMAQTPRVGSAEISLIASLSLGLRKGRVREIDSLAEAIIQQRGLKDFFSNIAPKVDAALRRQTEDALGGLQDAALGQQRLQELLQRLTPRLRESRSPIPHGRRVLLVSQEPARGGRDLRLTAECLSRDGWDVLHEQQSLSELIEIAQREWFAVLMISTDPGAGRRVADIIRTLRRAACNPDVKVLVISQALAQRPDRLARLGADAVAADMSVACLQARRLVTPLPAQL